eukprot:1161474-Pelagomonas_calceolata.AAC.14
MITYIAMDAQVPGRALMCVTATRRLPPTVELEAPSSTSDRSTQSSADTTSRTNTSSVNPLHALTSLAPAASPAAAAAAAAATSTEAAQGSSRSSDRQGHQGHVASLQGSHHGMHAPPSAAAAPSLARTTLPPLSNLQSLSALHVEVARPRHMGPAQEAPPSAQPFLHLFPALTHLSL